MTLAYLRKRMNRFLEEERHCRRQVREEKARLVEVREKIDQTIQAQQILQGVAAEVQHQAHERIASLVSRCLESVFPDDPYTFKIHFEQKRGKTEARLAFERDGQEVDPLTASGGGVIDVASFALRLTCLLLSQPPRRRLLVLDEAFRMVSPEYIPRVAALLRELSEELGVQLLLVTHNRRLQVGEVIDIGTEQGRRVLPTVAADRGKE